MKRYLLLLTLLLLAILNRPDFDSFLQYVHSPPDNVGSLRHFFKVSVGIFSNSYEFRDYWLFSLVKSTTPIHQTEYYLGLFNTWFPISIPFVFKNCDKCIYGLCLFESTCYCLPSYVGTHCGQQIAGFASISSLLSSKVLGFCKGEPCFIGIPLRIFPPFIQDQLKLTGIAYIGHLVGILDFILLVNVLVYFLWKVAPGFCTRHFTDSYNDVFTKFKIYQVITSGFSHASLIHLLLNMTSFIQYGRVLIDSFLGTRKFIVLYFGGLLFSTIFSLLWRRVYSRSEGGAFVKSLGASGAVLALKSYFIVLEYESGFLHPKKNPVVDHLVGFVLFDMFLMGPEVDLAAHAGGIVFGYLFSMVY